MMIIIPIGKFLTAGDNSTPWLSSSGDFAFGFRQLTNQKDLFLLSIWFDKIPDKTIVWYPIEDKPTVKGSKVELIADRGLVLTGPLGEELWTTNTTGTLYGYMNDTGNFVLQDSDYNNIWESFKDPSDTLLPTQIMERGGVLSSRRSETNFSKGRFQLRLVDNGNLVLNTINLPTDNPNEAYYASQTTAGDSNPSSPGKQLIFNESGYLFILRENNQRFALKQEKVDSTANFYFRATLNFDGVFIQYSHPKTSNANGSWTPLWSVPDNICIASSVSIGSGTCGFNSICTLKRDRRPMCTCPEGYSLLDPNDQYGSCKPDFIQGCEVDKLSPGEDLYTFNVLINTDWPFSDYAFMKPYTEDECQKSCLEDCFCAVAIFSLNNGCFKKSLPFSNGRVNKQLNGSKTFIKIRKNNSITLPDYHSPIPEAEEKKKDNLILMWSILLVKKLNNLFQDSEKEFKTEVNCDWSNTSTRIWFDCLDSVMRDNQRLLVYEFYEQWHFSNSQIIHCDIKPQNILLDDYYNARISDFGLAKRLIMDQSKTHTNIRGTKGYVAPEWFRNMPITAKVDVYSYGVMLLEIICCQRSVDMETIEEEKAILTDWAYDCYREGRLESLVKYDVEALDDWKKLERFVMVAIWCIQEDPSLRPTMRRATQMLEGVVEVLVPPCPYPYSKSG
uniref:Non-specific serine/threonine protein kinase n=1 Tax=Fagus sylvatica TaxID=28930 RepID=A0A2N9HW91_FAGSY